MYVQAPFEALFLEVLRTNDKNAFGFEIGAMSSNKSNPLVTIEPVHGAAMQRNPSSVVRAIAAAMHYAATSRHISLSTEN